MERKRHPDQLELTFTEETEVNGEPTLPLGHVLEAADEMAEHEEDI